MLIANTTTKLQTALDSLRFRGGTRRYLSLISTRGDLHEGRGAVINTAKTVADIVIGGGVDGGGGAVMLYAPATGHQR